jgi:hypothetical protein
MNVISLDLNKIKDLIYCLLNLCARLSDEARQEPRSQIVYLVSFAVHIFNSQDLQCFIDREVLRVWF